MTVAELMTVSMKRSAAQTETGLSTSEIVEPGNNEITQREGIVMSQIHVGN